jgi:hypothetical protein
VGAVVTTLHLGVVDLKYDEKDVSTGDVAGWLEDKYHIMELFFEENREAIAEDMHGAAVVALERLYSGAPVSENPLASGMDGIKKRFDDFITLQQVEKLGIPGVPTQAALDGVSHRKKSKRVGKRRPSFFDTGLYVQSFLAWLD